MAEIKMNTPIRQAKIMAYVEAPKILDRCVLQDYPAGLIDWRPDLEGAWTIREHLVHVADADVLAFARFGYAIAESGLSLTNWDKEGWCQTLSYCQQSATVALQLIRLLRSMVAGRLKGLSPEQWDRAGCIHPVRGAMSLDDLVDLYTKHIGMHDEMIRRNEKLWQEASPAERGRAQACR